MRIGDLVTHPMTKQLGVIIDMRSGTQCCPQPYKVQWLTIPPVGQPRSSSWGWYDASAVEVICE